MGTLYIVATPIGNREDITLRALRVLREVAVVAAEDTRHTGRLLAHYGIDAKFLSLHEHNEHARAATIIARLDAGDDVALVSDAGTPTLSDPGADLVAAVAAAGHPVVPVPGASALLAAVMASGAVRGPFTFVGFLPPKQAARRAALLEFAASPHPLVLYEAPHRVAACLADARAIMGERTCVVYRELTKLHEEITRTTLAGALARVAAVPPRGEYVLIIAGAPDLPATMSDADAMETMRALLAAGESAATVAKTMAAHTGQERDLWYKRAVSWKRAAVDTDRADA